MDDTILTGVTLFGEGLENIGLLDVLPDGPDITCDWNGRYCLQSGEGTHVRSGYYRPVLPVPLLRSVSSRVGIREDAEDLTADIFLKAVSGVDYERPPKMIQRWLFQVVRTTLIDHWRTREHHTAYSLEALLANGERELTEDEADLSNATRVVKLQQFLCSHLTLPSSSEELPTVISIDPQDRKRKQVFASVGRPPAPSLDCGRGAKGIRSVQSVVMSVRVKVNK